MRHFHNQTGLAMRRPPGDRSVHEQTAAARRVSVHREHHHHPHPPKPPYYKR